MNQILRYTTDGQNLIFLGSVIGPLENFAFGGPDGPVRRVLAQQAIRFVPGVWRHCGWSLCIHPEFGTGLPLATDGTRVVFYVSPSNIQVVHKTNLIGPIGPWTTEVADWNYGTNSPRLRIPPAHVELLKEIDARYFNVAAQHPADFDDQHSALVERETNAGGPEALAKSLAAKAAGKPSSPRPRSVVFSAMDEALRILNQNK